MNLNATILGQAIAFVLFVLFCMKYVWPPLMAAIEKRQKEIADGLASAERAHKDLDLAKASATDQLKKAKAEAQVMATTAEGMVNDARKLRSIIADIVVKVPVTAEGLAAIKMLKAEGIPTLEPRYMAQHKGCCRRWQVRNMLRLTLIVLMLRAVAAFRL